MLEYDDVMNEQRRVVYKYRREVLEGRDMSTSPASRSEEVVASKVDDYTPGDVFEEWDLGDLEIQVQHDLAARVEVADLDPQTSTARSSPRLSPDALAAYDEREEEFGEELMRQLERQILLQIIDNRWKEHLAEMDYMREGIHLRGFAQIDPLVAYKNEGYTMFQALMDAIWEEFARLIFHVDVQIEPSQVEEHSVPRSSPPTSTTRAAPRSSPRRSPRPARQPSPAPQPHPPPRRPWAAARSGGNGGERRHQPGHGGQGRGREDRPQRPLLVRVREEVQEVPRRLNGPVDGFAINPHLLGLRPAGIRGYDANHMATLVR